MIAFPVTLWNGAAAAPYQGPGDIVASASAWWGLRSYNAAYATGSNNAVKIRRSSDNATQNIVILSNGKLDVASISSFIGGGSAFVDTLYDQTGNGFHFSQATTAKQPQLALSVIGSLPAMLFDNASSQSLHCATAPTVSQPLTVSHVSERIGRVSSVNTVFASNGGGSFQIGYGPAANQAFLYAGVSVQTATANDSVWHAIQAICNAGSSVLYVNGSSNSVSTGSGGTTTSLDMGVDAPGNPNLLDGYVAEVGLWSGGFSGGNQSSMNSNQRTYWGF